MKNASGESDGSEALPASFGSAATIVCGAIHVTFVPCGSALVVPSSFWIITESFSAAPGVASIATELFVVMTRA